MCTKSGCLVLLILAFVAGVGSSGCRERFTCENMAEKNRKCMDEIVDVMIEGAENMPDKMKKELTEEFRRNMSGDLFERMCMESSVKDGEKEKLEKFRRCFKERDCRKYAECLKEAF